MAATASTTGLAHVDRYWRQVVQEPGAEYLHASLLGLRTYRAPDLHDRVEEGLSWHALERLRRTLDVPLAELSRVLRIAPRTLARRKKEGRLQPDESDRLLRLSRITGLALRLFEGDLEAARTWLKTPHRALGGQVPLRFAATGVGAREVENLLGRLEHGVVT